MRKIIAIVFLLAILATLSPKLAFAQTEENITEVILTTNISYADFAVASVAASKIGAALFFVSENEIPAETLEAINSINPEKIYIIGGPAVVSKNIEDELSKDYEVVRIWGMTRYGTASEVAKYFWSEGSEEAILIWDKPDSREVDLNVSLMIVKAAEEAASEEIPLLLIPKNHLSNEVEDALKTLNVSKVKVYGNVGSKVFDELNALGISYESIPGDPSQIRERIGESIRERFKYGARPIIVAAVANWQEGVAVRASPHGVSILVFSESEINNTVEKVNETIQTRNVSKVLVTGKPELARKIYDALIDAGINESVPVYLVSGKHYRVAKKIFEKVKERIKEIRERYQERLKEIKEKLAKLREKIKERCEYWFSKANETIETLNTSLAEARYALIEELYNSCVNAVEENRTLLAIKYLNEIKHETRKLIWENRATAKSLIDRELEKEEESASLVREREKARWEEFVTKIRKVFPARVNECRSLVNDLKNALNDRNFERARKIKVEIARKCAAITISREGKILPLRRAFRR